VSDPTSRTTDDRPVPGGPAPGAPGPVQLVLPDAGSTRAFGRALAGVLRAGDLVVLTGDLGAGKTTLTQGIGAGLGVRGQVASPTFIVAREHPSLVGGPALVHVDAYRLGSLEEVDALDLDSSLDESVTVVEWGSGLVESLAGDRLEVVLERPRGAGTAAVDGAEADGADVGTADDDAPEAGARRVTVRAVGARWAGLDVAALARDTGSPDDAGATGGVGSAVPPSTQP
jgi:tRNA threonylcarbamoyladenosine biosynthesis protein TsaE